MVTIHFHYCAIKNPFCEHFFKKIIICISRIIFKLKGIKKCFKLPPRQIKLHQNVKLPTMLAILEEMLGIMPVSGFTTEWHFALNKHLFC